MQKERFYIMRIIIDTEKERIILLKNFFCPTGQNEQGSY
jgi:hypothetical protein